MWQQNEHAVCSCSALYNYICYYNIQSTHNFRDCLSNIRSSETDNNFACPIPSKSTISTNSAAQIGQYPYKTLKTPSLKLSIRSGVLEHLFVLSCDAVPLGEWLTLEEGGITLLRNVGNRTPKRQGITY